MAKILIKRGLKANIPAGVAADAGELINTTDNNELYVRNSTGTAQPVKVDKSNVILGTDGFMTSAEKTKLSGISTGATKAESSSTNGNIKIDGVEKTVYTHPTHAATEITTTQISGIGTSTNVQASLQALKDYADALKQGLDVKDSVRVATTGANITLSGLQTIDGVALAANDRVLVKDQTNPVQNGIYIVASGSWTRAVDGDSASEISGGTFVFVEDGSVNTDSGWVCTTNGTVTVGTSPLSWAQFSGAGSITAGTGLSKSGNTLSLATSGVTAGTYTKVTVDAYGRATSGASLAASDIPSLDWSKITSGKPTTLGGYGITDAAPSSHVGAGGAAHANANGTTAGFMSSTDFNKLAGVEAGANKGVKVVRGQDGVDNICGTGNMRIWCQSAAIGVAATLDPNSDISVNLSLDTVDGGTF